MREDHNDLLIAIFRRGMLKSRLKGICNPARMLVRAHFVAFWLLYRLPNKKILRIVKFLLFRQIDAWLYWQSHLITLLTNISPNPSVLRTAPLKERGSRYGALVMQVIKNTFLTNCPITNLNLFLINLLTSTKWSQCQMDFKRTARNAACSTQ